MNKHILTRIKVRASYPLRAAGVGNSKVRVDGEVAPSPDGVQGALGSTLCMLRARYLASSYYAFSGNVFTSD